MYPQQQAFFQSLAPRVLLLGAFGSGKTHPLCLKAIALALRYPRSELLLCRKEFASLRRSTLPKLLELAKPYLTEDGDGFREYNKTEQALTFPAMLGGSKIWLAGLDQPSHVAGMNIDWAGIDESEEIDQSGWRMIDGRMRAKHMPFRQVAAVSNPCPPGTYQHQFLVIEKNAEVIRASAKDNPFNPPDFVDRLASFKGIYYDRYVLGLCVGAEGLVYDNFDPKLHVIPPFEIPADWPRYRAIDFGYANPFACGWLARQPHEPTEHFPFPKNSLFVYREIYRRHMLVEDAAKKIRELSTTVREGESFPEKILATWADWDAEDRATLNRYRIPTLPALKEVSRGIQTVHRRLAGGEDGKPTLYFFENLTVDRDTDLAGEGKPTGLLEEIGSYVWEETKEGKTAKEAPKKDGDHAMDWLRYAVMGIEQGSVSPVSFL